MVYEQMYLSNGNITVLLGSTFAFHSTSIGFHVRRVACTYNKHDYHVTGRQPQNAPCLCIDKNERASSVSNSVWNLELGTSVHFCGNHTGLKTRRALRDHRNFRRRPHSLTLIIGSPCSD